MYMSILSAFMCVYQVYTWCPQRRGEGIKYLELKFSGGYEPPYESWELNTGLHVIRCNGLQEFRELMGRITLSERLLSITLRKYPV